MSDKLGIDGKPTKYKAGFIYTNQEYTKCELIEWVDGGFGSYRWKIKLTLIGRLYTDAWTDDKWIDICLGKAYLDENTHQIVYKS